MSERDKPRVLGTVVHKHTRALAQLVDHDISNDCVISKYTFVPAMSQNFDQIQVKAKC